MLPAAALRNVRAFERWGARLRGRRTAPVSGFVQRPPMCALGRAPARTSYGAAPLRVAAGSSYVHSLAATAVRSTAARLRCLTTLIWRQPAHMTLCREDRRARVRRLADVQGGVLHRRQLYAAGITRSQLRAELKAERWRSWGRQTIAVHTGALSQLALFQRAVFETGADAALDGVSALAAAGLENFESSLVHLSVSKSTTYRRPRGVRVHETRRRRDDDVLGTSPPRVRAEVAAIRAALWATTSRQAALILMMAVQQRICTPAGLQAAFVLVKRDQRRRFIAGVLADVAAGAQSMGELDFARMCRSRGLPEPDRQVRRKLASGRVFLDVYWERYGVVVEIEGLHHLLPDVAIADSLRQNRLTIDNDKLLRIPVIGLRIAADEFLEQVEQLLSANGWQRRTAAA